MKKISYLLASAASALAALMTNAATAKTVNPELRADQTTRGSSQVPGAIKVSQAAKNQVGVKVQTAAPPKQPRIDPGQKTTAPTKVLPGVKAGKMTVEKFTETPFNEKDGFWLKDDFKQSSRPETNKTLPAANVKGSFQKNQAPKQGQ